MFKSIKSLLALLLITGFVSLSCNCTAGESNPKSLPKEFNVAGYYGNSGNVVPQIPVLSDINPAYNIVILTFVAFSPDGIMNFEIQGPYESASASPEWTKANVDQKLLNDINDWKSGTDLYGRKRYVLVSVGGEKGSALPENTPENQKLVKDQILGFIKAYNLDGFDVDVEGAGEAHDRSIFIPLLKELKSMGKIITSAPQAFVTELNDYKTQGIYNYCDFVGVQCYNQAPNSMQINWPDFCGSWAAPSRWDALGSAAPYEQWMCAIWANWEQWNVHGKITAVPYGVLVPASAKAAGGAGGNPWDFNIMSQSLINLYDAGTLETNYVGTWSVGCDIEAGNPFASAMTKVLEHIKQLKQ